MNMERLILKENYDMKNCPVCNKKFTRAMMASRRTSKPIKVMLEHMSDGRGVVRCPHCQSRLRKKISIWFFIALIPFIVSTAIYTLNHQYAFLIYLSVAIFMIVYINLPYVPYDT